MARSRPHPDALGAGASQTFLPHPDRRRHHTFERPAPRLYAYAEVEDCFAPGDPARARPK